MRQHDEQSPEQAARFLDHQEARLGRAQDEARELTRWDQRRSEVEAVLQVGPTSLGECDECHRSTQYLREDSGEPGGFRYCPTCFRRLVAHVLYRQARQREDLLRVAALAGLAVCRHCHGLHELGQSCGCFDNGGQ